MKYFIDEILSLRTLESKVHVVNMENANGRFCLYRQIVSIEGFLNRAERRWIQKWRNNNCKTHNTLTRFDRIFTHQLKSWGKFEVVEHGSVWDFYDSIGYNHKDRSVKNIDSLIIVEEKDHRA